KSCAKIDRRILAHLRILPETWLSLRRISHPKILPNPKNLWRKNGAYANRSIAARCPRSAIASLSV
ncbi:MAG TPA: hypothetical protein VIF40_02375, partial [Methylosinus sp.]|uniref:hypothetical protein n=1 Tax=Methylosinus sp. TaxID=427 RepID=UPI002F922E03